MPKTEAEILKSFQEEIYAQALNWNVLYVVSKIDNVDNISAAIEVFDYDNEIAKTVEVKFRESSVEFEY